MHLFDVPPNRLDSGSRPVEPMDIQRARRFIHDNYMDGVSLGAAARAANISAGPFSEKFKQMTGFKFIEYIGRLRVERVCELLRETSDPISQIAFEVGFQSLSQFNRVFRKFCGQSPTQYRAGPRVQHNLRPR